METMHKNDKFECVSEKCHANALCCQIEGCEITRSGSQLKRFSTPYRLLSRFIHEDVRFIPATKNK